MKMKGAEKERTKKTVADEKRKYVKEIKKIISESLDEVSLEEISSDELPDSDEAPFEERTNVVATRSDERPEVEVVEESKNLTRLEIVEEQTIFPVEPGTSGSKDTDKAEDERVKIYGIEEERTKKKVSDENIKYKEERKKIKLSEEERRNIPDTKEEIEKITQTTEKDLRTVSEKKNEIEKDY